MTTWVLSSGLPGTGKSTLAKALAARLQAAVLDKDRVREALFPGPLTDYAAEQDQVCIQAMLEAALYLTRRRQINHIIFDGRTFSTRAHIEQVVTAAERAGACWRILHLTCADAVAESRLAAIEPSHPAKNRGPELYRTIKQRFEPIVHARLEVDTTLGVDRHLEAIEAYLKATNTDQASSLR